MNNKLLYINDNDDDNTINIIDFGKYKGKNIIDIILIDPNNDEVIKNINRSSRINNVAVLIHPVSNKSVKRDRKEIDI